MDEGLAPRAVEPRRPVGSELDPARHSLVLQVLTTEHFSLLTQRSLVYNEAFTRVGMFLTFLSMSLVALALLSGTLVSAGELPAVAAIVLGFDLVIGLATLIRVNGAYGEDFQAVQAMTRIRHAYILLAPETARFISTGTHDDLAGIMQAYGGPNRSMLADLGYGLSTSAGIAAIVVTVVAGAFVSVVTLTAGASGSIAFVAGALAAVAALVILVRWGYRTAMESQRNLDVRFPTPTAGGLDPDAR